MQRRDFIKYSIACATALYGTSTFSMTLKSANDISKIHIVICGAGYAGLSVAKSLKELNAHFNITIIEQNKSFISCPFSNAWLGEVQGIGLEQLTFSYESAIKRFDYNFIHDTITNINRAKKEIYTINQTIQYDYMILAPGIDYDYEKIFGHNQTKIEEVKKYAPAALKPIEEHQILKESVVNFKSGNFIITIPSGSYRCPPAPYERACMIAHYFKTHHINGKVLILDPRKEPAAKPKAFLEVFNTIYKEYIQYEGLTNFIDIDFTTKMIHVESFDKNELDYLKKEIAFEKANIIPPNKANKLISIAHLELNEQGWAKLKAPTFESSSDESVYILGDAQGEYPYPKSAQMANSTAHIVAQALYHKIHASHFDYTKNMPGNICYSLIDDTKAVSIMHTYAFKDKPIVSSFISKIDTPTAIAAKEWYQGLTSELFGI